MSFFEKFKAGVNIGVEAKATSSIFKSGTKKVYKNAEKWEKNKMKEERKRAKKEQKMAKKEQKRNRF